MATTLNPYLSFRGQARQAMEFYRSVLGGELGTTTFGEAMPDSVTAEEQDNLMHAQLVSTAGLVLMGSDAPMSMAFEAGSNISVSLSGSDEAELTGYYDGFSAAGTILEPLAKAPWGDSFGMVRDQFGVVWMFNIGSSPV
ncbi:VOC family protein [Aeromicrobium sp.]|uniref:VOC family protein n=1 Tax=Aeromicrobium sp. TaxID=1871063 RepID=UPI001995C281|nr:VOC family protein [Aeromicrobium sp.]MBC7633083.1 VOC family protein [Aeromicrobium sp.]